MNSLGAASLAATNTVHEVQRMQANYWKCMGEAVETTEGAFAFPSIHPRAVADDNLHRQS